MVEKGTAEEGKRTVVRVEVDRGRVVVVVNSEAAEAVE